MTALHIPMSIVLVGIVLRASAFVIRKYDVRSDALHRRWSLVFGVSSLFTPFFLGVSLGALGSGDIRVTDGVVSTGFVAGWTRPFALSVGVFAQALFAFLAATYLTADAETDDRLRDDFRARALVAGLALAPAAALVFILSRAGAPVIFEGLTDWWAPLLLAATSVCAVGALLALWRRRYALARIAAAAQVALILIGWGLAQYPHIVVPDLTFENTATDPATLRLLIQALTGGAILLFPCFILLYRVFKGSRARTVEADD
jgi:cytochrome d ubiquinol oxidase subunit II